LRDALKPRAQIVNTDIDECRVVIEDPAIYVIDGAKLIFSHMARVLMGRPARNPCRFAKPRSQALRFRLVQSADRKFE